MGQMTISRERRGYLRNANYKVGERKLYSRLSPLRYHFAVNQGLTIAHEYQFPPYYYSDVLTNNIFLEKNKRTWGSHLWSDCVPFWRGVVVGTRLDLNKRRELTTARLMEMGLSLHVVGRTPEMQNKALNTSIQKVFYLKKC